MILFFFTEAIRSILKAKASFILTVISLSISILLILSSFIALQSSNYLEKKIKDIVKVNLFLKESVLDKDMSRLKSELKSKFYISQVRYISKKEAADLFLRETGEDFRDILDYNPLPASFVLAIKEEYSNSDSLEFILSDLSNIEESDEVVFQNQFVYRILNFLNSIKIYLFITTLAVILIALYLVYTTIRLVINSKEKEFETMKLVGAKLSAIKIPVLLNGLLAGIFASLICVAVYLFLVGYLESINSINNLLITNKLSHLFIMIFTGPVLGFIVTFITLRKITLKI
jgi:cell division transport system permease protein